MATTLDLVIKAHDQFSSVTGKLHDQTSGIGKAIGDVGKIASGFVVGNIVSSVGGQIQNFVSGSVDAAKDLGESLNAVNVVFGDSAAKVLDWGKTNATSFGLSNREFNQLVTPLGAMLTNYGFSADEAAGHSIDLAKRASDMASVFNTDVGTALEAIQAGLRGEADPLEKFGVGLNAAAIEGKALAMTGKETASSLTDQEKKAASLALIMEQTAKVQGDFANTSDEIANKERIQAARTEELQAKIGSKLIPVQMKINELKLKAITLIVDKLIPAIEKWGPKIEAIANNKAIPMLEKAWKQLGETIDGLMPVIEPVLRFFKENEAATYVLIGALAALAIAIGGPITTIIGLITIGTLLLAHWDEIKAKGTEVWDAIVEKVRSIPILGAIIEDTFNTIKILMETYVKTYIAIFEFLFATFRNTFALFKAIFEGDWAAAWDAIKAQFQTTVDLFDDILGIALDALTGLVSSKLEMLKGVGSDIGNAIWDGVKAAFGAGTDFASSLGNAVINALNNAIPDSIDLPWPLGSVNIPDNPIPSLGGSGSRNFNAEPIPRFARGGIFTRPTLGIIGEAGPEAVIPLSRGGGMGGTSIVVNGPLAVFHGVNMDDPVQFNRTVDRLWGALQRKAAGAI